MMLHGESNFTMVHGESTPPGSMACIALKVTYIFRIITRPRTRNDPGRNWLGVAGCL
jgi:hypothetical protein